MRNEELLEKLTTASHQHELQSIKTALDDAQIIIDHKTFNPKHQNAEGDTAIHLAVRYAIDAKTDEEARQFLGLVLRIITSIKDETVLKAIITIENQQHETFMSMVSEIDHRRKPSIKSAIEYSMVMAKQPPNKNSLLVRSPLTEPDSEQCQRSETTTPRI